MTIYGGVTPLKLCTTGGRKRTSADGLASAKTSAVFVAAAKSNVKSLISKPLGKRREAVKGKTSGGEIQCFKRDGEEGNSVCEGEILATCRFLLKKKNAVGPNGKIRKRIRATTRKTY